MAAEGSLAADAVARLAWDEAYDELSRHPGDELGPDDLEALATAAYMTGRDSDAVAAWDAAHRRHLAAGGTEAAALCAFWSAFTLMMGGHPAQASGWLGRARTLVGDEDCPAAGYVMVPAILGALGAGDGGGAREMAAGAARVAERFDDADLAALCVLGDGQALLALGEEEAGLARLDEVMVSVVSGDVGPVVTGIVYCAVILECMRVLDLARATEWTAALDAWCRRQSGLVPYRGQCLVHRSQVEQASGDWSAARTVADEACRVLGDPPHPALGLACYHRGELHRLAGELEQAEAAYRRAAAAGFEPMPGLALLDLARGEVAGAVAGIQRSLEEAALPYQRPPLLAAAVEIHLAGGDHDAARAAADELAEVAAGSASAVLAAMADEAAGSVRLAAGDATAALGPLRAAQRTWQRLDLPYEGARAARSIGRACLARGDRRSAEVAFESARDAFRALGARLDLDSVPAVPPPGRRSAGPLSAREREVLELVAGGRTNPQIAAALDISRHTVGRHLQNIFAKLGVTSRAAATAYAYEHGLL